MVFPWQRIKALTVPASMEYRTSDKVEYLELEAFLS